MFSALLPSSPFALPFSAVLTASVAFAFFRRRAKRQALELSAALKIIDQISHEQWLALSEADKLMPVSTDCLQTLSRMTELAVPSMADFCAIELVEEDGSLRAIRARDASEAPRPREKAGPSLRSVLNGEPLIYTAEEIPEDLVRSLVSAPPKTPLTAVMAVPIRSAQGIYGALVFGLSGLSSASSSRRRYGAFDLDLARQLATRAMLAIENSRLYRKAQLALQARENMMAIVAHELKNPLTAIGLQTQHLLATEESPGSGRAAQYRAILAYARSMQGIINDLLDLDRIERGRLALRPRPENALKLVSDAVEMMRPMASEKKLDLALETLGEASHLVLADRLRVSQVVSNLVGNAIKFTPAGGRITLRARLAEAGTEISVSDTGSGMTPEQAARAFDRYWQDEKTAHLGSGLGLAVAKGIVDLHGGSIAIESRPGAGTTVRFTLPSA
jgi:signal transduction histidine kinase